MLAHCWDPASQLHCGRQESSTVELMLVLSGLLRYIQSIAAEDSSEYWQGKPLEKRNDT